jgi:hypothetical protein
MVIACFIGAITFFAMINFMGSFLLNNNAAIPSNLAGFYGSLGLNSTNSSISILSNQAVSAGTNLKNGNIVAGVGSTVGVVVGFFTSLPNILGGFMNYIAFELAFVGIPTTYAVAAAYALIIMMIMMGILSAIFIFGV